MYFRLVRDQEWKLLAEIKHAVKSGSKRKPRMQSMAPCRLAVSEPLALGNMNATYARIYERDVDIYNIRFFTYNSVLNEKEVTDRKL